MHILVVEDDNRLAGFIVQGLEQAGYAVHRVDDGLDGFHCATTDSYDLIVLDIMLPKLDGLSLLQDLRKQRVKTPVLILSAKRSVDDRVRGLQAGGDDYLVKPFALTELLARVQALLRRASDTPEPTKLIVEELEIDLVKHRVTRGDREIELTSREFALLEYLVRNAGRVVSKAMIMEHVWGYHFDPQTNVVESQICRLRDKIDRAEESPLINTVRGVGYVVRTSD